MKFVIMALLTIGAATASAKTVICVDRNLQDSTMSSTFNISRKGATVTLFVPTGETSGENFQGDCRPDRGAIETAYTCNVMTSTDSGYEVRLYSIGGSELYASVTSWSMAGNGTPLGIPCDN